MYKVRAVVAQSYQYEFGADSEYYIYSIEYAKSLKTVAKSLQTIEHYSERVEALEVKELRSVSGMVVENIRTRKFDELSEAEEWYFFDFEE